MMEGYCQTYWQSSKKRKQKSAVLMLLEAIDYKHNGH